VGKTNEAIFAGSDAISEFEENLGDAGAIFDRTAFDRYDNSVELYEVPEDHRLPDAALRVIFDSGFSKVFVNHVDGWETQYSFGRGEFTPPKGWRVSYPNKRGEKAGPILLEERCDSWPAEWFNTGYAMVVAPVNSGEGR